MKPQKIYFRKDESLILGGIAVLMMVWDHLFAFPDWYLPGVGWSTFFPSYVNSEISRFSSFGGICVEIFAFMSGYSLYVTTSYNSPKKRLKRLVKFMLAYWLVFLFFILIGFLNGDILPTSRQLLFNLAGVFDGDKHVWVPFAWYVTFYIEFIIVSPILLRLFRSDKLKTDLLAYCGLIIGIYALMLLRFEIHVQYITYSLYPMLMVGAAMLCAKYDVIGRVHSKFLGKCNSGVIWLAIALIVLLTVNLRNLNELGRISLYFLRPLERVILALGLILCSIELINRLKSRVLKRFFGFFGTISLYLWFLHGIFFMGKKFMQQELYMFKEPILIYLICIFCLAPVSYLLFKLFNFLFTLLMSFSQRLSLTGKFQ